MEKKKAQNGSKSKIIEAVENIIRIMVLFILTLIIVIMTIAIFDNSTSQEAAMGSFGTMDFNQGWKYANNPEDEFSLPITVGAEQGNEVYIYNTLPENLSDGMSLMIRTSIEDIYIYVDNELRSAYSSDRIDNMSYYIPSAYVVTGLDAADSGKTIVMHLRFKHDPVINEVRIGNGNNVWFEIIKNGIPVIVIVFFVLIIGIVLVVAALFIENAFNVRAPRNLGLLIITIALWVISESPLRQFIFHRATMTQYFSYLLVELMGALACLFFDEVQHRVYHVRYVVLETLVMLQINVNIVLHTLGIADLYTTMHLSHAWTMLCAIMVIINIITDIITGRVKEYIFTMVGMICFIIMSTWELISYYTNHFHTSGTEICLAIVMLIGGTVVQTVYDEVKGYENRAINYTKMTINTIETIAGAIDARDEYTGGHSERVGLYAQRLAREMAADYDFTEEDILRIHYIGLIHDIGKIGVADSVLNKTGRLNDEEFSLMKKHTEIGYEIMSAIGGSVEGLLDGIRYHHERFDGKGYPDGLSDTDIPLIARILALADSYDAMTSNRVYRDRLADEIVRQEFIQCSGTQFDPAITEIFVRLIDSKEISPYTIGGVAVDDQGAVRTSALLEKKLQKDMLANVKVENPSHIRMLCYVMKLMEKKGKDYRVIFFDAAEIKNVLSDVVEKHTDAHDIKLHYTDTQYIIALFEKTEDDLNSLVMDLKEKCPIKHVEILK